MKSQVWSRAIQASADPARVRHFLELFSEVAPASWLAGCSAEQARVLAALFSGSLAQTNMLLRNPGWLSGLEPDALKHPRRKQGLLSEIRPSLDQSLAARDYATALARVRQFKQRETLRIAARDLAGLGCVEEIILELSNVADVTLQNVWQICLAQLTERFGRPCSERVEAASQPATGCVLGLGKLGGQELNYSSDVDLMIVYSDEGHVSRVRSAEKIRNTEYGIRNTKSGGKSAGGARPKEETDAGAALTNHQFFNRLAQSFVSELTQVTPEGSLYRIDLRLRPEGEMGPLARSVESCENYYAQWGQTWERLMLIKARAVAGDPEVAAEFLDMIQPFRYPRSINPAVLREVAAMKDRIENEVVKAGELDRNVKLGRGGIREIEFIAQSLQLLHAGRQPFLQGGQTVPCLDKLAEYGLLSRDQSRLLGDAYSFLRRVEHRLQMEDDRQTHTIPSNHHARTRLARLMEMQAFDAACRMHTDHVRRIFEQILRPEKGNVEQAQLEPAEAFPAQFDGAEQEWKSFLAAHAFKDPDQAFRLLREFVEGPGYVHVSPRTTQLAWKLVPQFFALTKSKVQSPKSKVQSLKSKVQSPQSAVRGARNTQYATRNTQSCTLHHSPFTIHEPPSLSDPDRVLARLDSFISAYGARVTLLELWDRNASMFDLLLLLFDRSEFLAELAIRTPDLVDELVSGGRLRQRKGVEETLRDLRHGLDDEDQHLWLRRYHEAELMRIGLRDILGLGDFEQYLTELTALADACVQYALEVTIGENRLKSAPFAIIGLGKLGGAEIDYGSDLDLLFVAGNESKAMDKLIPLAARVMDLLSRRTERGIVFHTDARLRPDGEKGLLVNTIAACEQYYLRRAQLWEIQTLTRARFVAGDSRTGARFMDLTAELTDFRAEDSGQRSGNRACLASSAPDWKQRIHDMRIRIERERTPAGKGALAIKTGSGGLMDAEFIAQTLCLGNGWQQPNTLRALELGAQTNALPHATKLISCYRRLRRVEGILRRWSYEGESVLPHDAAPFYRVSVRCGFRSPHAFRTAVAAWRKTIRAAYLQFFRQG